MKYERKWWHWPLALLIILLMSVSCAPPDGGKVESTGYVLQKYEAADGRKLVLFEVSPEKYEVEVDAGIYAIVQEGFEWGFTAIKNPASDRLIGLELVRQNK